MFVSSVARTKFYIGNQDIVPLGGDYTEIGNISNLGALIAEFKKILVSSVGDGYTRQLKGSGVATPMTVVMNRDDQDPGQMALRAANRVISGQYNFKVLENESVFIMFKGAVFAFGKVYGQGNKVKQHLAGSGIEVDPSTIQFGVLATVAATGSASGVGTAVGMPPSFELREDGGFELREDGGFELRE